MTKRTVFVIALASALCIGSSALAQNTDTNERFQALVGMARVKRDAGDLAAARRYFEDARRVRPFDAAELGEYFWVLAGQDARAALAVGREVLTAAPTNRDVRDRMITESLTLGDEASIVALAEEGLRRQPGTALWPRRLAESYQRQGMPEQAIAAFVRATQARDAMPQDHVGLALSLEAARRYPEAIEAWSRVPAAVRAGREDWERSRLRVLAHGTDPDAAATELDAWLRTHPRDEELREVLVDLWVRAGQPLKALAVLQPLPADPSAADRWLRRRLSIAQAARLSDVAAATIETLKARGTATTDEQRTLVAVWLEQGQTDRAATLLRAMSARSSGCDGRILELIDRIPGKPGTDLMLESLAAPRCNGVAPWLLRGIDRAVAASDLRAALSLMDRLPQKEAQQPDRLRLAGQLRLWTGDAAGAVRALESALHAAPTDTVARETLVDAYRAGHNSDAAWRTAEPLIASSSLSTSRLTALAELAIEANRPGDALRVVDRLPNTPDMSSVRASLRGRSWLALGRPADAREVLASLDRSTLTPPAALALIDSTNAVAGPEAALDLARQFTAESTEWRDVLARRVLLEAVAGDQDRSAALRRTLASLDPDTAIIADAEIALAHQRNREALTILSRLPSDPQPDRAADLEATGRAGVGDFAGALAIVSRLQRTQPNAVHLILRQAEWQHRMAPTPETLTRIVELPTRFPGNQDAAMLAAGTLAALNRHADALTALGPSSAWSALPVDGRVMAARSLHALGRDEEALGLVSALPTTTATTEFRAELETALAAARLKAGQTDSARSAAARAIDLDPSNAAAWHTLLDASGPASGTSALTEVVQRFDRTPADAALTIGMAEHLAAFVRSNDDPLIATALSWLDRVTPADNPTAMARHLARARVYAAAERWSDSLQAVDAALAVDGTAAAALKLRAELLSWSGRRSEALVAYDTYLTAQPQDVAARRQQARVAGWDGQFGEAKRLYAALQTMRPDDERIAAEAAAKGAFFDARWRAAVEAYARWIALEPGDSEARFEYAEALRADGQTRAADAALAALQTDSGHRLAMSVLEREQIERGPAAEAIMNQRSTNGYAGQRLLDLSEYGGALRATVGQAGRTKFTAEAASTRAAAGDVAYLGYRAGVSASGGSRALTLDGHAAVWDFSGTSSAMADLLVRAAWRPADRWTVSGGADQVPLFENLTTIERGITAAGLFADAMFESPRANLDVRLGWQNLSDGNARQRATVTFTGTPSERLRQVRVVGWFESLAYRTPSPDYFSPDQQLRLDVGLEYTHDFTVPRFRGDRASNLSVGYLIGTDDAGTTYHHPSVRLILEFTNGLALDARANWIRSQTYDETSAFVGLRIQARSTRR